MFKAVKNFGLAFVFPPRCVLCQKNLAWSESDPVCDPCWRELRTLSNPFCSICGYPLSGELGQLDQELVLCPSCRTNPPPFWQARSVFLYEGNLRHLVHLFKYKGKARIGKMLTLALVEYEKSTAPSIPVDCIVPVPIEIKKLRVREFNQAYILAKALGKALTAPVYPFALKKRKSPTPQVQLSRVERLKNIEGAFLIRRENQILGRQVLLIDDVYTTGATIIECSRILLQHGARGVRVLTLARSIMS